MKKIFVAALTVALTAAFSMPASAFESEFGGYFRARAYTMKDFSGQDTGSEAKNDSRTRLYYTAKFNDNFKLVNKFEVNHFWGDDNSTVGEKEELKVKQSYADFTTGAFNFKVGKQPAFLSRALMMDDDFSGITVTYNAGKVSVPFMWMSVEEEDHTNSAAESDRDHYAVAPVFNLSDTLTVSPFLFLDKQESTDQEMYYVGADVDVKIADASVWATAIIATGDTVGTVENAKTAGDKLDTFGYLVAAGANAGMLHTQFIIASGDDDDKDGDNDAFVGPAGQSYYWSEIMGLGILDNAGSAGSCKDRITNLITFNIGATIEPMDKLTVSGDIWYAQLAEEVDKEDYLGTEVDVTATYAIMDNLNLDLVAAYLFAGDATAEDGAKNKENPYEFGTRLSFSF